MDIGKNTWLWFVVGPRTMWLSNTIKEGYKSVKKWNSGDAKKCEWVLEEQRTVTFQVLFSTLTYILPPFLSSLRCSELKIKAKICENGGHFEIQDGHQKNKGALHNNTPPLKCATRNVVRRKVKIPPIFVFFSYILLLTCIYLVTCKSLKSSDNKTSPKNELNRFSAN